MRTINLPNKKELSYMSYSQIEKLFEKLGRWYERYGTILDQRESERKS